MNKVTPMFKVGKRVDDPKYRTFVRQLPCVICDGFGFRQTSRTECHHTIHGRHSLGKTSCFMSIPICECHHTGLRFDRDKTKIAIHQDKTLWEEHYGPDTGFIAATQDTIERVFGYRGE